MSGLKYSARHGSVQFHRAATKVRHPGVDGTINAMLLELLQQG